MLRIIQKVLLSIILLLGILSLMKIDDQNNQKQIIKEIPIVQEDVFGRISIPKINLEKTLYNIGSNKNNIEENITILKESIYPDQENSIMFIAAHSGTGEIAYFNNLDQLEIGDQIIMEYNNKKYIYQINNIQEQQKSGFISGKKEKKKQLVLTTCCPKKENCQLIINSIEKESY